MPRDQIISDLKKTLKDLLPFFEGNSILEHPANSEFGDYSTNIAMQAAGTVKANVLDLAEKIVSSFPKNNYIEKIEVVKPGFINFYLNPKYLYNSILEAIKKGDDYGKTDLYKGQKMAVEYTDPNPFKEFHLGHLYSNVIGESIALLFEANGAKVWRGDFYGDAGMHISKSIWGMRQKMQEEKLALADLEKLSVNQRQAFLGKGYALGVVKYDENEQIQNEIKDINYMVYVAAQETLEKNRGWKPIVNYKQYIQGHEDKYPQIKEIYQAGLRWSLDYFESIYKKLGTKFDGYYPESWVGEYGMKIVEKGLKMGILEKSEGSVIYRGEQDGLHTRVFVNKLGLPTYEAKDLGLAFAKYQDFKYDFSLNIFGKEIDEYYKVVRAALIRIEPELGKKAHHLAHGMVKLPQGKMSSRSGNVVTFEWLVEEAKRRTLKIMEKTEMGKEEKERVAEIVGLAAIRYALLKSNIGSDVIFDFEKSITFDGDSGPYLQYAYARCQSVLRKANNEDTRSVSGRKAGIQIQRRHAEFISASVTQERRILNQVQDDVKALESEELSLLRTLYRFPEIVASAGINFSPNLLCGYLFGLAQKFNLFYNRCSILKPETRDTSEEIRNLRLRLTAATAQILKNGLNLLGIKVVEKM